MSKKLHIEVSKDELKLMLIKKLRTKDISEAFIDLLLGHIAQSSQGFDQLFKAMLDLYPKLAYKTGDHVWIAVSAFPSWKVNLEETMKLSNVNDGLIIGTIKETNPYETSQYNTVISAISASTDKLEEIQYWIPESQIKCLAEGFSDIMELMEPEDLPF